jgi:hypothetical protein
MPPRTLSRPVRVAELDLSNWLDLPQMEEHEKRYLEVIKKYRPVDVLP